MTNLNDQYSSAVAAVHKIIPDGERSIVIARGQRLSDDKWWFGDRSNKWAKLALESGEKLTREDSNRALSQDSGVPIRTLRHYADHARFFDPEIRAEFEILPFSHFTIAKQYGEQWYKILNTSTVYFEEYGKLPTADYLRWKFSEQAKPILELDEQLRERTRETFEQEYLLEMPSIETGYIELDTPQASEAVARDWIDTTDRKIKDIAKSIDQLPLSTETKTRLRYAVANLNKTLEACYREISVPNPANRSKESVFAPKSEITGSPTR